MFHADNPFGDFAPAVNVKATFARFSGPEGKGFPSVEDTVARFHCSEATAEKALEYAFECLADAFWQGAEEIANEVLGGLFPDRRLTVWQQGRSGGWLTVEYEPIGNLHGACNALPPANGWDARQVAAWGRFEQAIREAVDGYCERTAVFDTIEANEWAHDADSLSAMVAEALA